MSDHRPGFRVHHVKRVLIAALAFSAACDRSVPDREFTGTNTPHRNWDQLFVERKIDLQLPPGPPLLRVARMAVGTDGNLFVPDAKGRRVLAFHPDGALIREIGSASGIQLSRVGPIARGHDGTLLIFDSDGGWMSVIAPDNRVLRRFQLSGPVADFVALRDSTIVVYYPTDEAGAFRRYDHTGKQLGAVHPIQDAKLRIFHGRVRTGGITMDDSEGLFGVEPSMFALVRFSPDLEVREIFRGARSGRWTPSAAAFPANLDPYDYRPAHEAWWDSFTHIGRPFAIAPGVVLVTLFTSRGMSNSQDFANIYRTDGGIVAEGLRVPHSGQIVGADRNKVYVVRNAHMGASDAILPMELYEYRLRDARALASSRNAIR